MGTFLLPITVVGPSGERATLEALVDTGATFTSIPAPTLRRLGISPHRQVRMRLADEASHVADLGVATVELEGIEEVTYVLFALPDAPPIIGAVTLEAMLLDVDPVNKQLLPVEAWQA